jgi:CHAT domain-containing protein/Tfp pilus assembly protein PilF
MLIKRFTFFLFVLTLSAVFVPAQAAQEPQTLESGKPIEREVAGGHSHTYKIQLTAGQFVRFRLEQRAIDAALTLSAPDGKPLVAMNLTNAGEPESLSIEAATGGSYRLTVQSAEVSTRRGSYRLEVVVQAQATVEHRKRLAAETLLVEVGELTKQPDKTAPLVIEKMQQALSLWRELGEPQWTAHSLYQIGIAYSDLNQFAKAIEHYEPALVIARDLKYRLKEANTLSALGFAYNRLSQYEKAIENYEQALAIYRELKNQEWEGKTLRAVSGSFTSMGRFEKALQYREQALVIVREANDRLGESQVLIGLGALSYRLGRTEKAIAYYEQALKIAREIKDRQVEDTALGNLAGAYNRLGRTEKAIEYFEQALGLAREIKDREGEAWVLSNLGVVYSVQGRYEKTVEYHEQALAIFRDLKSREREANTLINLGGSYANLGRSEKAIAYYEQALAIYRERKIRDGGGSALLSLGEEYSGLGRSEKAIEYFEQALAIFREVKNRPSEAKALNNLGSAYASLGHHEKAIAYYEQALGVAREVKNRITEGDVLNNLGNAFRSLRRVDESIRHHEQALGVAREIKGQTREAAALNSLMLDWKASNQVPLAIYFGKQSVNTYQEIRSNLRALDAESQRSFLKSKEQTYRDLADLLIAQGRLPEAEQVIRMLKDEEYFEFIRRDQGNSSKTAKAALTPEEQALEKRYREIADRVAELGSERGTLIDKKTRTPEEEQRLVKLDADLVVAGIAFQKFLDGLAAEMGRNSETGAKVFALRESQGLMEDLRELGKGTVALYTLVGEDKYRLILTTANFQKAYEYPIKAVDLNRKVLEFREALQNPKYDPLPLAQELYKILVGPVAKDLQGAKAQVLMWSLDGVLRYLPVSALNDGKQYLIEHYRNTVFTPASQSRLLLEPGRKWTALGLGVTKAQGNRIPALPGVLEEMHGIIREAGGEVSVGSQNGVLPGTIKLDEAFTQEAMMTELRKRNPVVHIASHFQFSPGNETNSALLLGDGSFLSLAQIKSLPNVFGGVELLTLSACNTATGGSGANGKEVEGFGVLAQRQGAKAVVASLWPVFDTSTKVLMQDFYRLREAKSDTTKVEALRQAQLRLLRGETTIAGTNAKGATADRKLGHEEEKPGAANKLLFKPDVKKPYAHPYYWAPFILIGNWK